MIKQKNKSAQAKERNREQKGQKKDT
jgi:hypothetical protein